MKRASTVLVAAVALLVPAAAADAAFKTCKPVPNVPALDGSRYEGSDIFRIRASETSCRTARRVAVRSTLKGMRLGANVLTYRWRRWKVDRDLIGSVDRYDATAALDMDVKWRFGSL